MTRYANKTSVGASRSVGEIEKTLNRYGADQFIFGRDDSSSRAFIGFRIHGITIKISVPLPDKKDFQKSEGGRSRTAIQAHAAWDQAYKQRWRAMALVIKAKLEAVESGITTIEQEFLAHILLPNNQTVADWLYPQLEIITQKGKMPALLPDFTK